jgi:hypothetical protein
MNTPLEPGESIVKQGPANLQRGMETVGGKLYLTNRRLVFEAHAFNIQTEPAELRLSDVRSMEKCWTLFLGFLPLAPNSLAVYSRRSEELRFVLWGRASWMAAIDGLTRQSATANHA